MIPELGRSPGEGKGYPLQHSGLENSMDCIVHGVTKSQTGQINVLFHFPIERGQLLTAKGSIHLPAFVLVQEASFKRDMLIRNHV